MWVRGLKQEGEGGQRLSLRESHPMWVRGLKRSGMGFVDIIGSVAPYVGAWIETTTAVKEANNKARRTLCGCVD